MVISGIIWGHRLVLSAAEVKAAAEATAATVTSCDETADDEHRLAGRGGDHEVRVDILFTKLLGNVQSQRTVVVVDVPLVLIAQN